MAAPGSDPEVRELSLAYARAIAITERLASELDKTVADLSDYVQERQAGVARDARDVRADAREVRADAREARADARDADTQKETRRARRSR